MLRTWNTLFRGSHATIDRTPGLAPIYDDAAVNGSVQRAGRRRTARPNAGRQFPRAYFRIEADFAPGSSIEFILTLPREITMAGDVHIRCFAEIVRVEPHNGRRGIAARIDRYEFLPTAA